VRIDEPVTFWHTLTTRQDDAIAVVVPVGPEHNPVAAVESSCRAARAGQVRVVHIIVLNGIADPSQKAEAIRQAMERIADSYVLVSINADVGYVRAVRYGLDLSAELGLRADRVGFLDADSYLRRQQHWVHAVAALDRDPTLDAISGLVIHTQCQVWETLSSATFIAALEEAYGAPVNKPYLQGGAGGSLARRDVFSRAVDTALRLRTLIGPTLSATSIAAGRHVIATSVLPCGHTPRRSMQEWTESVTAYERSWRTLVRLYGTGIETPWLTFLSAAERAVADKPALLLDLLQNVQLRRAVVEQVEADAERLATSTADPTSVVVAASRDGGST
jgi:hypothetical protein